MSLLNKTKLPYLLLGIGIFMVFGGGGSLFIVALQEDHEEVNRREVDVREVYQTFIHNVEVFETERDSLYGSILSDLYYDELADGDDIIKDTLSNYASIVDEIEKKTKTLDGLCEDMYYSDKNVNKMCSNYKFIYEQVNNCLVKDITSYNDTVKNYNVNNVNQLDIYKIDRKYIDYNNDKNYDGK